jgi:hypothetical protein
MNRLQKIAGVALVVLFFGGLWLPLALSAAGYDPIPRPNENRNPAERPGLPNSLPALQAFPQAFDDYYKDHFGGRNVLVYSFLWFKSRVLGVSPTPMAVVGKGDWTYLGHDQQLAATRGVPPLNESQLAQWCKTLKEREEIAARHGAHFLAFFGPDKSSIYPEYLPDWLKPEGPASNLDRLHAYVAANCEVPLLDLRPALLAAKPGGLTYLRSNSHWNNFGAFVAYQVIAAEIQPWLPTFRPVTQDDVIFETRPRKDTDLEAEIDIAFYKNAPVEDARMRAWHAKKVTGGIPGYTGNAEIGITEHEDKTLPKLVCFHDSFAWALLPFFANSFSRVVYVRQPLYSEEIIALEKPDLVIFLRVERELAPPDGR